MLWNHPNISQIKQLPTLGPRKDVGLLMFYRSLVSTFKAARNPKYLKLTQSTQRPTATPSILLPLGAGHRRHQICREFIEKAMPNGYVMAANKVLLKLTVAAGHLHVLNPRLDLQEPVQDVLLVGLLVRRPILKMIK